MRVAVLPIPALIEYTKNHPHPLFLAFEVSFRLAKPILPCVVTMQKMKRPKIEGNMTAALK